MNEAVSPSPDAPGSPGISAALEVGKQLYAARKTAQLSQAEIAARLRLSERQVIAMETGDLAALPGATFARGFIRNYALAVGLDPKPLLAMLEQVPDLAPPALNFPKTSRIAMPAQHQTERKQNRLMLVLGLSLLVIAVVFALFAPTKLNLSGQSPEKNAPALPEEHEILLLEPLPSGEEGIPASPPGETPAPSALPDAALPAPTTVSSARGTGNLLLEFLGESWIEITDRNEKQVHSRLHEANSNHELTVTPPVSIVIGRASAVRLYYQGKPVPLKPNSNDVAVVRLQ